MIGNLIFVINVNTFQKRNIVKFAVLKDVNNVTNMLKFVVIVIQRILLLNLYRRNLLNVYVDAKDVQIQCTLDNFKNMLTTVLNIPLLNVLFANRMRLASSSEELKYVDFLAI